MSIEAIKEAIQDLSEREQRELAEWVEVHFLLPDSPGEIHEKIGVGLAQLARGEGIPGEVSRAQLQEKKAAWLKSQPR